MGYLRTAVLLTLALGCLAKDQVAEGRAEKQVEEIKPAYDGKDVQQHPYPAYQLPPSQNPAYQSPKASPFSTPTRTYTKAAYPPPPAAPKTASLSPSPVLKSDSNRYYMPEPSDNELKEIVVDLLKKEMLPRLKKELPYILNPCEKEYTYFPHTKKCYYSPDHDTRTWYAARDQCKALGGVLASFIDRYTQVFLSQLCVRRNAGIAAGANQGWCWVGAYTDGTNPGNANALIQWLDGTPFVNTNPDLVQPASTTTPITAGVPTSGSLENCMYQATDETGAGWQVCTTSYNFVCQKDPIQRPSDDEEKHEKKKFPPIKIPYPIPVPVEYHKPEYPHVHWDLSPLPPQHQFPSVYPKLPPKKHPYNLDPNRLG